MFPYLNMLRGVRHAKGLVYMGKVGATLDIISVGETSMKDLGDVLYVPELVFGIISVPQLDKTDCTIVFCENKATVYNTLREIILIATLID